MSSTRVLRRVWFVFGLLCFVGKHLFAQYAPPVDVECLKVQLDGSVIVEWNQWDVGLNPNIVPRGYRIIRSVDGLISQGTQVGIQAPGVFTFTDASINANQQVYFYHVIAEYNYTGAGSTCPLGGGTCLTSPGQVLKTILLLANPILEDGSQTGFADLNWNSPNSDLSLLSNPYDLYRDYYSVSGPNPVFPIIPFGNTITGSEFYEDKTKGPLFSPPNNLCNDFNSYQVRIETRNGCMNESSIASVNVIDEIPPLSPIILSASVDPITNEVILEYAPDPNGDATEIQGYYIIHGSPGDITFPCAGFEPNIANNLQTFVHGNNPSTDPKAGPVLYDIESVGFCPGNGINPCSALNITGDVSSTPGNEFVTSYLEIEDLGCEKKYKLTWTPLEGLPDNESIYEHKIYLDLNQSGVFEEIAIVDADSTWFLYEGVAPNTNFRFYIAHVRSSDGYEINSNVSEIQSEIITPPTHIYINCVSVIEDGRVAVRFNVPSAPSLNNAAQGYRIKRSEFPDQGFESVGVLEGKDFETDYLFVDQNVKTGTQVHYYTVEALESCDSSYAYSDTVSTILLSGKINDFEFLNTLLWNRYEGFNYASSGTDYYDLYRTIGNEREYELFYSFFSNEFTFKDDFYDLLDIDGKICYYLQAIETTGTNAFGLHDTCNSNEVCLPIKEIIWMPSAFTPDGDQQNDSIGPVLSFVDKKDYQFTVTDRWGQEIWFTNKKNEKFSGFTDDGKEYPQGMYIYRIEYTNGKDEQKSKHGMFFLIR